MKIKGLHWILFERRSVISILSFNKEFWKILDLTSQSSSNWNHTFSSTLFNIWLLSSSICLSPKPCGHLWRKSYYAVRRLFSGHSRPHPSSQEIKALQTLCVILSANSSAKMPNENGAQFMHITLYTCLWRRTEQGLLTLALHAPATNCAINI